MSRVQAPSRGDYRWFTEITTRWSDNDIYGHVNNVMYYSYFDSIANRFLIREGGLDIHDGETIGFVVNSNCDYFSPVAFPQSLTGALRVNRLGNSSVEYGIGVFAEGEETASAAGTFTHVFVERANNRPSAMPESIRAALASVSLEAS